MRYVVVFVFSVLHLAVFCQNADPVDYYFIGLQSHYGFIIPHTAAIEPVSHTKPYGVEVSFNRLGTSFENWRVFHHYNISGIQAGYYNFQNPGIVGSAFALSFFTEPVLVSGDRYIFSVKAGAGFSWQTKIYDFESDTLNKFFSTRISFPLSLSARFKYRISDKIWLTLSGNYNHISNGAIRIPNYGMNFPTVSAGIEFLQKPFPDLNAGYPVEKKMKLSDQYLLFQVLNGYKVVWGETVASVGFSARYVRQLRTFYALNAGAELFMDGGAKRMIKIEEKSIDYKSFALTAGQDFILGKIVFTQYLGVYVYSPYKPPRPVYQKYELSYRALPDFLLGVYVKAYTSDADLFGFTINYVWRLSH